jgi:hypothetical protein
LLSLLRLHSVPDIGTPTQRKIVTWAGGTADKLGSSFNMDIAALAQFRVKGETTTKLIASSEDDSVALRDVLHISNKSALLVTPHHPSFTIYIRGNSSLLNAPGVAFSGCRNSSRKGSSTHVENKQVFAKDNGRRLTHLSNDVNVCRSYSEPDGEKTLYIFLPPGYFVMLARALRC